MAAAYRFLMSSSLGVIISEILSRHFAADNFRSSRIAERGFLRSDLASDQAIGEIVCCCCHEFSSNAENTHSISVRNTDAIHRDRQTAPALRRDRAKINIDPSFYRSGAACRCARDQVRKCRWHQEFVKKVFRSRVIHHSSPLPPSSSEAAGGYAAAILSSTFGISAYEAGFDNIAKVSITSLWMIVKIAARSSEQ